MAIGIDPTIDFACKRVLGNPDHPAITLHFLNSVLQFPCPIRKVQILNPSIEKDFEDDKWSLLDILATDELDRLYNIEVQTTRPMGLRQRLTYYACALLTGQMEKGDAYHKIRPTIGICLLDAIEFGDEPSLRHNFQLRSPGGVVLTDCLQIHLFELPKYVPPSDNGIVVDPISQWLYFFCRAKESTAEELTKRLPDPVFAEATGVLQMISMTPRESYYYNLRLKMERDARAKSMQIVEDARAEVLEQGRQEGIRAGRQEGLQEGRQEGLQEGRQEGIQEGIELGATIGRVQLLQELNGMESQSAEVLAQSSIEELTSLEKSLQQQLRGRL